MKNMPAKKKTTKKKETFKVSGDELLAKVKELIKEGNIRRLIIKDSKGKVLVEFPLTIGVVFTVLAPVLAAIGAIAALVSECSIVVEREE
jgi:CBS domain-containing protein